MTKQSGMGDRLFVAGYNLSGDIGSLGRIGGGPAALDVTGIDKEAFERIGGLRDGAIEYSAFFNPATDQAHERLSALPTADQVVTYCRGAALGNAGAALVGKQINYDPSRGADGSLTIAVQALANGYGLEWGRQLTAGIRTDTGATNGSSVDHGASTAHGLQAYLHVMAFTGTSAAVKVQESSDNGGADSWADVVGGGFTVATGITSQRIATAAGLTVERYLRVVTTGTFSNAQFAVLVCRNETAVSF
ncbi:hypothetical protein OG884_15500 [Streptosporangium sp. NBC_01755]|uniref:hypothetical protein n=1 Tax=Streptosporangium sp. NBC_01755 TaxID=2975949 RepID=UPI002DD7D8F0|nr:hypothetical protein [Streptosporangium sp. NBC_01755]WSD03239.1 hypothetical protein OG884_15500 [Streptosporangium sp. NBC_01755]